MQTITMRIIAHQTLYNAVVSRSFCSLCDSRGRGEIKVTWADTKRNDINLPTHEMVTYALQSYAIANDWLKPFEVQGFTSAYLPINDDDNAAYFMQIHMFMEERDITLHGHFRRR